MISILVSGFYPEPNLDNSLHYKKIVPQALVQAVLSEMGWITLADVPMGENDLTQDQAIAVMAVLGDAINRDLMYYIGLCR